MDYTLRCFFFFTITGSFLFAVIDDQYSISLTSFFLYMPNMHVYCVFLAYSLQIILTYIVLFCVIYCILYSVLCLYHVFSPDCTLSEMAK